MGLQEVEKEVWKPVCGYEELYAVSTEGRVKRVVGFQCKKDRLLKDHDNGSGYRFVHLSKDSKVKQYYVHRLVALAFIDNEQSKEEVNHIDGDRSNNRLCNLEWVTRSENHYHRYNYLKQKGVNLGKTGKLNWNSKPVVMKNLDGKKIKTFPAVMEAMRQTGINDANIRQCIYGKTHTAGGYKWEYL